MAAVSPQPRGPPPAPMSPGIHPMYVHHRGAARGPGFTGSGVPRGQPMSSPIRPMGRPMLRPGMPGRGGPPGTYFQHPQRFGGVARGVRGTAGQWGPPPSGARQWGPPRGGSPAGRGLPPELGRTVPMLRGPSQQRQFGNSVGYDAGIGGVGGGGGPGGSVVGAGSVGSGGGDRQLTVAQAVDAALRGEPWAQLGALMAEATRMEMAVPEVRQMAAQTQQAAVAASQAIEHRARLLDQTRARYARLLPLSQNLRRVLGDVLERTSAAERDSEASALLSGLEGVLQAGSDEEGDGYDDGPDMDDVTSIDSSVSSQDLAPPPAPTQHSPGGKKRVRWATKLTEFQGETDEIPVERSYGGEKPTRPLPQSPHPGAAHHFQPPQPPGAEGIDTGDDDMPPPPLPPSVVDSDDVPPPPPPPAAAQKRDVMSILAKDRARRQSAPSMAKDRASAPPPINTVGKLQPPVSTALGASQRGGKARSSAPALVTNVGGATARVSAKSLSDTAKTDAPEDKPTPRLSPAPQSDEESVTVPVAAAASPSSSPRRKVVRDSIYVAKTHKSDGTASSGPTIAKPQAQTPARTHSSPASPSRSSPGPGLRTDGADADGGFVAASPSGRRSRRATRSKMPPPPVAQTAVEARAEVKARADRAVEAATKQAAEQAAKSYSHAHSSAADALEAVARMNTEMEEQANAVAELTEAIRNKKFGEAWKLHKEKLDAGTGSPGRTVAAAAALFASTKNGEPDITILASNLKNLVRAAGLSSESDSRSASRKKRQTAAGSVMSRRMGATTVVSSRSRLSTRMGDAEGLLASEPGPDPKVNVPTTRAAELRAHASRLEKLKKQEAENRRMARSRKARDPTKSPHRNIARSIPKGEDLVFVFPSSEELDAQEKANHDKALEAIPRSWLAAQQPSKSKVSSAALTFEPDLTGKPKPTKADRMRERLLKRVDKDKVQAVLVQRTIDGLNTSPHAKRKKAPPRDSVIAPADLAAASALGHTSVAQYRQQIKRRMSQWGGKRG